jgi:hypothetical protein
MGLLSIDISKVKKPSLIGVNIKSQKRVNAVSLIEPKKVERRKRIEVEPQPKETIKPKKYTLLNLALDIIGKQNNISKQNIIDNIKELTEVDKGRAERDFNLMLKRGLIKSTPGGLFYYLKGSTPF